MVFESVRGYVELASGMTELTRARAMEAAHGLLSLPSNGLATGGKMAVQVGALADELMTTAAANRSNLRALVRSEVDVAVTRLGLVPAQKLEEAQAEAARLRAEVSRLRSASLVASAQAPAPKSTTKKAAAPKKSTTRKAAAPKSTTKKAAAPKSTTRKAGAPRRTAKKSAVTTRIDPAGE